jgi:5-methylcytosine-specific restriction endonuclease McrA
MSRLYEFLKFTASLFENVDYRRMPYRQYLNTYHWQQLRLLKLSEVEERCQLCYSPQKPLHVHHRTYARLGNEKLTDLTVLCKDCHTLFHQHRTLTKPPKRAKIKKRRT